MERREHGAHGNVPFAASLCSVSSRIYLEENVRGDSHTQKLCDFS